MDIEPKACKASLCVRFPEVDWPFLQQVYGWTIKQYQAWTRGYLVVLGKSSQTVVLFTENVLEFLVNGNSYFGGDAYGFRKAPLVLKLDPGEHRLEIRLVRDVRSMGGLDQPSLNITIEARISKETLSIVIDKLIVPDVIDGKLPSVYCSVPVRNNSWDWIEILEVDVFLVCVDDSRMEHKTSSSKRIGPGQTRPLLIFLEASAGHSLLKMVCKIQFAYIGNPKVVFDAAFVHTFVRRVNGEPHKFTFLHPSGCVSYAILRPPALLGPEHQLPVMLALHGAGVEADSADVRHSLDKASVIPAWTLFPSGMSPWSGDDWHAWGFSDVFAAIEALRQWINIIEWDGPGVDIGNWLVCGHSNGGQGTWHALTHYPGRIMGAAPVSGYSSIQSYVPYTLWTEVEPFALSVIQASLAKHRHELLCTNFINVPVLQQHGGADDNVPAFHSRRMRQLILRSSPSSGYPYSELAGRGHWFQGVMTTPVLLHFYKAILSNETSRLLPITFDIVVTNPAEMIPIGGVRIDQLESPDQFGNLNVRRDIEKKAWYLQTRNILRFHFDTDTYPSRTYIIINGCIFQSDDAEQQHATFFKGHDGAWKLEKGQQWKTLSQRYGSFNIVFKSQEEQNVALQISRNLYQYFSADSSLNGDTLTPPNDPGNVIVVAMHRNPSAALLVSFPIQIHSHRIGLHLAQSQRERREYELNEGEGAIFLRPLPDERLELCIWGFDPAGLQRAARLVPMLTGVGQPDFIILGKECAWKGIGGVLAMGFFDSLWRISEKSYIT